MKFSWSRRRITSESCSEIVPVLSLFTSRNKYCENSARSNTACRVFSLSSLYREAKDTMSLHEDLEIIEFESSPELKIPKIPDLVRTSSTDTSPCTPKTLRKWTVRIESFHFCRRSPLNSQNSAQESPKKLVKIRKFSGFDMQKTRKMQSKVLIYLL